MEMFPNSRKRLGKPVDKVGECPGQVLESVEQVGECFDKVPESVEPDVECLDQFPECVEPARAPVERARSWLEKTAGRFDMVLEWVEGVGDDVGGPEGTVKMFLAKVHGLHAGIEGFSASVQTSLSSADGRGAAFCCRALDLGNKLLAELKKILKKRLDRKSEIQFSFVSDQTHGSENVSSLLARDRFLLSPLLIFSRGRSLPQKRLV